MFKKALFSITLAAWASLAPAQTYVAPPADLTSAEGSRYMHQVIKDTLLSFKQEGDTDLIYFTAILGWRCGMSELYYGLNDDPIVMQLPLEPCYRQMREPNAMPEIGTKYPFFIKVPTGSATRVRVRMIYEDGSTQTLESERARNLMF